MADVAKLKKKAAEFELKKQFDKALAVYVEILDAYNSSDEEIDVALYNRVGDLYLKQGNVADAVDYYEQAIDRYADGGFFNNAIALCNKVLRNSPGRATVYYKLGKISAQKGFNGDAKANFLEYADRMQQSGKFDEAFRALKEFADLCPDQDDIRLMLADQLSKKGRGEEAVEQLQLLYERYTHEGREMEARATLDRMKAIDPSAEPRSAGSAPRRATVGLVFLDLDDRSPAKRQSVMAKRATHGLELLDAGDHSEIGETSLPPVPAPAVALSPAPTPELLDTPVMEPAVLDGVTRSAEFERSGEEQSGILLQGLEATSFATPPVATEPSHELLDFEPTSFTPAGTQVAPEEPTAQMPSLLDFDLPAVDDARDVAALPGLELELPDDGGSIGGDLELIMPEDVGGTPARGTPVVESGLDDIPLIDFELPMPGEATASITGSAISETDPYSMPTPPPARRSSTMMAEHSVELLQALSETDVDDHGLRRRLAEAMLESGDREGGLRELEVAMIGYERADDLTAAAKLADEIVMLNPSSVRHHQKRVEYAFRTNERGRLIEAYLQLADALFRAGQMEKSRAIYQRVIDLAPDDLRALAAMQTFPAPEPEPAPPPAKGRSTTAVPRASTSAFKPAIPPPTAVIPPDDEYINLGDWLRDDEAPKDTRMVVEEKEPTGDEQADFQDMLRKFKQGIAANVDDEDHQSHYDLGVAYKEMGLLDEAIAEFQKALRSPTNRVPTYEALGLCFLEKEQYPMAATILGRALAEKGISDDQLVGVLYLMGRCAEERGQREAAVEFYQRVFVVDIQFRDVGDRLAAVEGTAP